MILQETNFKGMELDKIPQDWEIAVVKSFLKITMGQSPSSEFYNDEGIGLPFYQGVSDFGKTFPIPRIWCSSPQKIANKNEILFSVRAPVGETNLTKEKCCIGRGVASLTPLNSDLRYCYYLVSHFRHRFTSYSQGTTFEAINRDEVGSVKLPFTSDITEQQKIASILSKVDELIKKLDQMIEQTRRLKKGLMEKLFTIKENHCKFYSIDDIRADTRNSIAMGPFGSNIKKDNFVSSGVPVIRGINLTKEPFNMAGFVFLTDEKADELKSANAFPGDLVFTHRGTLGQVGLIPANDQHTRFVISQSQMKLTPDITKAEPLFLYYFFLTRKGQNALLSNVHGTGVPAIGQPTTTLRRIRIALPPISEQKKIANFLLSVNSLVEIHQKCRNSTMSLKRGLMQKLLTGKIRVKV